MPFDRVVPSNDACFAARGNSLDKKKAVHLLPSSCMHIINPCRTGRAYRTIRMATSRKGTRARGQASGIAAKQHAVDVLCRRPLSIERFLSKTYSRVSRLARSPLLHGGTTCGSSRSRRLPRVLHPRRLIHGFALSLSGLAFVSPIAWGSLMPPWISNEIQYGTYIWVALKSIRGAPGSARVLESGVTLLELQVKVAACRSTVSERGPCDVGKSFAAHA